MFDFLAAFEKTQFHYLHSENVRCSENLCLQTKFRLFQCVLVHVGFFIFTYVRISLKVQMTANTTEYDSSCSELCLFHSAGVQDFKL